VAALADDDLDGRAAVTDLVGPRRHQWSRKQRVRGAGQEEHVRQTRAVGMRKVAADRHETTDSTVRPRIKVVEAYRLRKAG